MLAQMNPPFPKQLKYMQPFMRVLAKLPADDLNEDVDPSLLEKALRKRLSKGDPETVLENDRQLLASWLDSFDSNEHVAHWILGYISNLTPDDLAEDLMTVIEGPTIAIEIPAGWQAKFAPIVSELRKGKLFAVFMVIDNFTYQLMQTQLSHPPVMPAPVQMERNQHAVTFGTVTGHKYVYLQTKPSPWKQVDYLLEVDRLLEVEKGYVSIRLCAMGDDFDEQEFEDQLATLKLA